MFVGWGWGQPIDALFRDKIVFGGTLAFCLNSVFLFLQTHPHLRYLLTPQRQPELITSECTPWNDGWALAIGLSGEGAGPYGSGIWKLIVEDGAKGGE